MARTLNLNFAGLLSCIGVLALALFPPWIATGNRHIDGGDVYYAESVGHHCIFGGGAEVLGLVSLAKLNMIAVVRIDTSRYLVLNVGVLAASIIFASALQLLPRRISAWATVRKWPRTFATAISLALAVTFAWGYALIIGNSTTHSWTFIFSAAGLYVAIQTTWSVLLKPKAKHKSEEILDYPDDIYRRNNPPPAAEESVSLD